MHACGPRGACAAHLCAHALTRCRAHVCMWRPHGCWAAWRGVACRYLMVAVGCLYIKSGEAAPREVRWACMGGREAPGGLNHTRALTVTPTRSPAA